MESDPQFPLFPLQKVDKFLLGYAATARAAHDAYQLSRVPFTQMLTRMRARLGRLCSAYQK
jgi:hypothetical protein